MAALPPGAVAADLTAGALHGLWLPPDVGDNLAVVLAGTGRRRAPRSRAHSIRSELRGRRRTLARDEIVLAGGTPATSEVRTWVDLAEILRLPDLVAAGDSVLRGTTELADLDQAVRRARGRRGVVRAKVALSMLDGRSRSRPESVLRCHLVMGGLPMPEVNAAIVNDRGEWVAEPDLLYRRARLALEYNGSEHANPKRMRRDITRAIDMVSEGWLTLTFGPVEVFRRPDEMVALVRTILDARDPSWRDRDAA
jgi:hypothetical protein